MDPDPVQGSTREALEAMGPLGRPFLRRDTRMPWSMSLLFSGMHGRRTPPHGRPPSLVDDWSRSAPQGAAAARQVPSIPFRPGLLQHRRQWCIQYVDTTVDAEKEGIMASVVVSARVDEGTRRKAEAAARRAGMSLGSLISGFVSDLATTGKVPDSYTTDRELLRRRRALDTLEEISRSFPVGTPLDTMTRDEFMEEAYGDRD